MRILHRETVEPVTLNRVLLTVCLLFFFGSIAFSCTGHPVIALIQWGFGVLFAWLYTHVSSVFPPQTLLWVTFTDDAALLAAQSRYEIVDRFTDIYVLMEKSNKEVSGDDLP